MVRVPNKYKEQFRAIDQLRVITEQEGKVVLYRKAKKGLAEFWGSFASTRAAFLKGESELTIDDEKFERLTQAIRDLLLLIVPDAIREEVRQNAYQSAQAMFKNWRNGLGDIEVLAVADLELRVLAKLALEVAGDGYHGETRLPDWNLEIVRADTEIALSCDAWRNLAEQ